MYGRVTHDLINVNDEVPSRVDMVWGKEVEGSLYIWRTLDDDRIPYYMGVADDATLEAIFVWSMQDAGTTFLQVLDLKNLAWKDELS
jgi:hypothetical protein